MSQPEADLRHQVLDALRRMGILVHPNNLGRRGKHALGWGGPGAPDIVVILKPYGRAVGLELKVDKNQATALQLAWGDQIREHGGAYFVVRSVAEAIEAVREAGKRVA